MLKINKDGARGGVDLTIQLTADQARAFGPVDGAEIGELAGWLDTVLVGIAAMRTGQMPQVPAAALRTGKDSPFGDYWCDRLLREASALLTRLEGVRDAALREHMRGHSVTESGVAMGVAKSAAQYRRDALGESVAPAELWAGGQHGPVDDPGAKVPKELKSWSVTWEGYTPVDITPHELRPEGGLAASVAEGWAEPYATPREVPDMLDRSLAAVLRYDLDDRHYPLNPTGRTGRTGRNLGKWGENLAGDLVATAGDEPQILLIKRTDNGLWATPGGGAEPGESPVDTIVREAEEEAGIRIDPADVLVLTPVYVEDWRTTDHAWIVTVPGHVHLPAPAPVRPADDAADARWWPCADVDQLEAALAEAGETLSPAHRSLIAVSLIRASRAATEEHA